MFNVKNEFTTQKLVYTALLVALNVLANIFSIPILGSNYISFTYLVCFLAGMYLGVVPAVIVGGMGDFLGCLLVPKGVFNPLILLSSIMLALIPALIFRYSKQNKYINVAISVFLCLFLCTAFLNTLGLWLIYGFNNEGIEIVNFVSYIQAVRPIRTGFWTYLAARIPFQTLNALVNAVLICVIIKSGIMDKAMSVQFVKRGATLNRSVSTDSTLNKATDESALAVATQTVSGSDNTCNIPNSHVHNSADKG
ncbi:MAG: folate family ECF transporter S component [Clostridia bacterium]|nr:folate family ECF transporter S component [Clostridia bacterium]